MKHITSRARSPSQTSFLFAVPEITAKEEMQPGPGRLQGPSFPGVTHEVWSHCIALSRDEHTVEASTSCQRRSHLMLIVDQVAELWPPCHSHPTRHSRPHLLLKALQNQ